MFMKAPPQPLISIAVYWSSNAGHFVNVRALRSCIICNVSCCLVLSHISIINVKLFNSEMSLVHLSTYYFDQYPFDLIMAKLKRFFEHFFQLVTVVTE